MSVTGSKHTFGAGKVSRIFPVVLNYISRMSLLSWARQQYIFHSLRTAMVHTRRRDGALEYRDGIPVFECRTYGNHTQGTV